MTRRLAPLVIVVAVVAASCGDDGAEGTTATDASAATETPVATTAPTTTSAPTTTVAATTTAAAVTTAAPTTPVITFDGGTCEYQGPDGFDAGTLAGVEVRNSSEVIVEVVFFQLDAGWTFDQVAAVTADLAVHGEEPDGIRPRSGSGPLDPGATRAFNVAFSEAGNYAVLCGTGTFEVGVDNQGFLVDHLLSAG